MSRKSIFAVAVSLSLIAACGGSGKDSSESSTTTTTTSDAPTDLTDCAALIGMTASIDPALSGDIDAGQVVGAMFDGLVDFDYSDPTDPVLKPLVADEWSSNPEMNSWTFHIKDGLEFSNGESVTPSSFAAGWNRAADPALGAPFSYLFSTIAGYAAVEAGSATEISGVVADDDAMTLTVNLVTNSPEFPSLVTHPVFSPVPVREVSGLTDQRLWATGVMSGNGPFMMEGKSDSLGVILVPNPKWAGNVYGDTSPVLTKLTFRSWSGENAAFAAFESGQCQTSRIPVGKYAELATKYAVVDDMLYGSLHYVFGWNDSKVGGEKNLKLRQAISLAINRDAINQSVYAGNRVIATGLIPPGLDGYMANGSQFVAYDLEKAKKLFQDWKDAGNSLIDPIKISFNANGGQEAVVASMQADLEALGVPTVLDPQPAQDYYSSLWTAGCEQICRAGKLWVYPEGRSALYELFSSETIGNGNLGLYDDAIFDDLVNQALAAPDLPSINTKLLEAGSRLLNDTTGYLPLTWYTGNYAYDPAALDDLVQTPIGSILWERVSRIG